MRSKYVAEVLKDTLFPWRRKRWNYVAAMLDHPRRGAELGVLSGRFTASLLAAHRDLHLIAVDLWGARPDSRSDQADEPYEGKARVIREEFDRRTAAFGDRLTVMRMSTATAAQRIEDESLDFIFIDADHSYASVIADIAAWVPKVAKGGWVFGHDYCRRFPGVMRAVRERFDGDRVLLGPDTVWAVKKC